MQPERSSRVEREIAHFAKDSKRWWDEAGPFRPLHRLNPVRIGYIRQQLENHLGMDTKSLKPFAGLNILDIGCGGGLACEALARLGARVTGIDADAQAIEVAAAHAAESKLRIEYVAGVAETLLTSPPSSGQKRQDEGRFDIVLALEIIEHVAEPESFVRICADLCRPGGLVILSTLNRTPRSFALGIVAAEYVLGWVPRGTHDWKKFVRPAELSNMARQALLNPMDVTGMIFNPLKNIFMLSKNDIAVNYLMTMEKSS